MRIPRSLKHAPLGWFAGPLALLIMVTAGSRVGSGQQTVPFQNGIPVAPSGLAARPLPTQPVVYDTAEGHKIRVVVVTKALAYPWSLAFLPDGTMLVTERMGRCASSATACSIRSRLLAARRISAGVSGFPGAVHGHMDVALHPQFAHNRFIYLEYTKPLDPKRNTIAVARAMWDGKALTGAKDIFVADEGTGTAPPGIRSRRHAVPDDIGRVCRRTPTRQDPNSTAARCCGCETTGESEDNPFVGKPGHKPEVYLLVIATRSDLRSIRVPARSGRTRTGPTVATRSTSSGRRELRLADGELRDARTTGPWQSDRRRHEGSSRRRHLDAVDRRVWMAFYTGDRLPKWKGDVFVGALRTGEIPGTGHIERILFNEKMEELRRESLPGDLRQRIRDVRQGPDGLLYVMTDEKEGALLRIEPAP